MSTCTRSVLVSSCKLKSRGVFFLANTLAPTNVLRVPTYTNCFLGFQLSKCFQLTCYIIINKCEMVHVFVKTRLSCASHLLILNCLCLNCTFIVVIHSTINTIFMLDVNTFFCYRYVLLLDLQYLRK